MHKGNGNGVIFTSSQTATVNASEKELVTGKCERFVVSIEVSIFGLTSKNVHFSYPWHVHEENNTVHFTCKLLNRLITVHNVILFE